LTNLLDLSCNQKITEKKGKEMAKIVFVVSSFYLLVYGVRAWVAVFAGDHYGVQATNGTLMVAGVAMVISLYFMVKDK
jgi:preprotein translocase subunit SecE